MRNNDERLLLRNAIEADLFETVLREEKIPCSLRSYGDLAYDGIYQVQKGWGHMEVPAEYLKKARALLDEIRRSRAS